MYITGRHNGTGSTGDIFLSRYDADGTIEWTKVIGGAGWNEGLSVATDMSGNAYLTGFFEGTLDFDPGADEDNHTSSGQRDIFLSKFDTAGTHQSTETFGSTSRDYGEGVTVSNAGNVYITGKDWSNVEVVGYPVGQFDLLGQWYIYSGFGNDHGITRIGSVVSQSLGDVSLLTSHPFPEDTVQELHGEEFIYIRGVDLKFDELLAGTVTTTTGQMSVSSGGSYLTPTGTEGYGGGAGMWGMIQVENLDQVKMFRHIFMEFDIGGPSLYIINKHYYLEVWGDGTPPTATIYGTPTSPTNSTDAVLTVGGTDVVSYKHKLDSGSYSSETSVATQISLSGLGEGTHTVSVIGKDTAGNWRLEADATTTTWTVDLTAPSGPIVIDAGATYCNSRDVTITLNSSDADYMCFSNDNTAFSDWEDYASSKSWTLSDGNGTKYVYVKYKDEADNVATVSISIILDTIAPNAPVLIDIGNTDENEPSLDWENVTGTSYYIVEYADNSDFNSSITVANIAPSDYTASSALADGTWYWRVKAVDAAGNVSGWSSTGIFTVDTTDYCESAPEKPVLLSPADGATNVSRTPTLTTSEFSDPTSCNIHLKTRWRISEHEDFHGLTARVNAESKDLTSYQPSNLVLKPNTTYYWKVRYVGHRSNESEWSDVFSFTTEPSAEDVDGNGIPDDQEVDDSLDLDSDGTPDNNQADEIKSIKAKKGNNNFGIRPQDSQITTAEAVDTDSVSNDGNKPTSVPYDLIAFRLEVPNYGDTATVKIHLSEPASENARWVYYDTVDGWQDYSDHAEFNDDRDQVTLTLKDGGYGDNDHTENGVIVDPSGVGIYDSSSGSNDSGTGSNDSGSESGCFIATAVFGSPLAENVTILKDFRDTYLLNNRIGRAFVHIYYKYSPALADFIAHHDFLRTTCRYTLYPAVGVAFVMLHATFVQQLVLLAAALSALFMMIGFCAKRLRHCKAKRKT